MKIKKLGVVLLMLCFVFTSLGIQAYAAEVGDQLLEPEDGWKRYEETDSAFYKKSGTWTNEYFTEYSGQNLMYSTSSDAVLMFKFKGTKIRLITDRNTNRTNNLHVKVTIDDNIIESYSTYGESQAQTLSYEKTDLVDGIHEVKLEVKDFGIILDAIDIDEDGELLDPNVPNTPINLTAKAGNEEVELSWETVEGADSYKVLWSTTEGGPYKTLEENISELRCLDSGLDNDTTYYYVVVAVNFFGESEYSNEVSATPEGSGSGDNALLRITMSNGKINEYDLSMSDVEDFIDWYEDRADDRGKPYYIIEKDYNIGPFESRKDYLSFDKILQFEVMEYNK